MSNLAETRLRWIVGSPFQSSETNQYNHENCHTDLTKTRQYNSETSRRDQALEDLCDSSFPLGDQQQALFVI